MASIWDLAVLGGEGNEWGVTRFDVPGGKEPIQSSSAVPSFLEGAASLMRDGYEPFSATGDGTIEATLWFRREVQQPLISKIPLFRT